MRYLMIIFLCTSAFAQEAHVVALKPEDAAKAKATYERMVQAQKDWEEMQNKISFLYLIVPPNHPDASADHYGGMQQVGGESITINGHPYFTGIADSNGLCLDPNDDGHTCRPQEIEKRKRAEAERQHEYDSEFRQRKGFNMGSCFNCLPKFDFSVDFKFIVPSKPEQGDRSPCQGSMFLTGAAHYDPLKPGDMPVLNNDKIGQ